MKEIYKNPLLYYIAVPVLLAIWPLSIKFGYLPNTKQAYADEQQQYEKAENLMFDILDLNPERVNTATPKDEDNEFDFVKAVAQIASASGIDPRNYTSGSRAPITRNDRKTQTATITIQKIDIEKFSKFITNLQKRWANLECESVNISTVKGFKDTWKITLTLIYYY